MSVPDRDVLQQEWVHAHEEDTEDQLVFRPASQPLPPARGRRSFDLRPDGTYAESSPGPVDVPEAGNGRWALDGDRLVLHPEGERPTERWRVIKVKGDELRLERPGSGNSA